MGLEHQNFRSCVRPIQYHTSCKSMVLDDFIVRTLETCRTLLEVIRTLNLHYHTGFTPGELFLHDSSSKF